MKWKFVVAGTALMVASACVPPPTSLSYNFAVSYIAPDARDSSVWTDVQGTVTNAGVIAADYLVQVAASSDETGSVAVTDVLVGQTALWATKVSPGVTISQAGATASPSVVTPVPAVAEIMSQEPAASLAFCSLKSLSYLSSSSLSSFRRFLGLERRRDPNAIVDTCRYWGRKGLLHLSVAVGSNSKESDRLIEVGDL